MKTITTPQERFWKYVSKSDTCWLWIGAKTNGGYGVLHGTGRKGKLIRAHRLSWEMINGAIPEGLDVCHTCDVPSCVNPAHLFLGTAKDNVDDMFRKGRNSKPVATAARGEIHGKSKVTETEVIAIRAEYASGASIRQIARNHPTLSRRAIQFIIRRRTWTHI